MPEKIKKSVKIRNKKYYIIDFNEILSIIIDFDEFLWIFNDFEWIFNDFQ